MDRWNTGGHPLDPSQIASPQAPPASSSSADQPLTDAVAEVNAIAPAAPDIAPADVPPPPTGQPTIIALVEYLVELGQTLAPAIAPVVQLLEDAFHNVAGLLDPAAGRELERETDLANMFRAKDVDGLMAYYNDQPPHPAKSRAICKSYLGLLGHPVA